MLKTRNTYIHPFSDGVNVIAISDPRVHFGHFKYAIDFLMDEGTPILAAREGTIVYLKDDSNEGGSDPKYDDLKYLNYMTLKHDNEEYSQYCHLKYKGVLVKVGDKVEEGQQIAISGNTGFTSAPHLHFMVFRLNETEVGWESLEIRWKDYETLLYDEEEVKKLALTSEAKHMIDHLLKLREGKEKSET